MPGSYERRIGRRVDVEPEEILWRAAPDRRRPGRWRRGTSVETGALLDLSVSGLRVRAPADPDLSPGAVVPVEIDGVAGSVKVRRVVPVPGTRFADFGLQITPTSHELADWARARLSRDAAVDEDLWRAILDHRVR